MIGKRAILWLDDRLGTASFAKHALRKAFPDHWSFMLGEIALYCFLILLASGVFLTFFFEPSATPVVYHGPYKPLDSATVSSAYASALRLSFEVRAGLLFRQIHHWAALLFVAAIGAHMARVFLTGAFRRPRELNWLIGTTLLLLALADGLTGYSLPDDLLSGTGLRIAYSVLLAVPLLGTWAAFLIFGGPYPSAPTLSRFFTWHILLIPGAIAGALALHLTFVWRQKHTQFPAPGRSEDNVVGSPLWPVYAMRSLALGLLVAAVVTLMGGLLQINPVWLYGPYQAWVVASPSQPDWYLAWTDGALRLAPGFSPVLFGHAFSPLLWPQVALALGFAGIYAWPFIERRFSGDHREHHLLDWPWEAPWRTAAGVTGLCAFTILGFAGGDDVQARYLHVPVEDLAWLYRFALPLLSLSAGFATYRVCCELAGRGKLGDTSERTWVTVRRSADGGFEERTEP